MSKWIEIESFKNTMRNSDLHESFHVDNFDCHAGFFSSTPDDVIVDLPLVCAYTGRRWCNRPEEAGQTTSGKVMGCHVHVPVLGGV